MLFSHIHLEESLQRMPGMMTVLQRETNRSLCTYRLQILHNRFTCFSCVSCDWSFRYMLLQYTIFRCYIWYLLQDGLPSFLVQFLSIPLLSPLSCCMYGWIISTTPHMVNEERLASNLLQVLANRDRASLSQTTTTNHQQKCLHRYREIIHAEYSSTPSVGSRHCDITKFLMDDLSSPMSLINWLH